MAFLRETMRGQAIWLAWSISLESVHMPGIWDYDTFCGHACMFIRRRWYLCFTWGSAAVFNARHGKH
jgi:hypothetical protein